MFVDNYNHTSQRVPEARHSISFSKSLYNRQHATNEIFELSSLLHFHRALRWFRCFSVFNSHGLCCSTARNGTVLIVFLINYVLKVVLVVNDILASFAASERRRRGIFVDNHDYTSHRVPEARHST